MLFSKSFSSHYVLCYSCCADFSSILLKVLGRVVVCRVCCVYVPGGGMSRGKRQNLCGACAFGRCLSGNPVECSQLGYCSNILRTARPPLPFPPFPRLTHGSSSEEQGDHLGGQSSKCQPNSFHVSNACQKHQVSFFCHFQWEPNCFDGSGSSILRLVRLRELCMCSKVAASICQPVWCTEAQT